HRVRGDGRLRVQGGGEPGPRPRPARDDATPARVRPHEADVPLRRPRLPPDGCSRPRDSGDRVVKIARIETHVCHARMRNWVFVKVVTDQDGLSGWGEATLEWHTRAVVGAVQDLAELIVGEDPTRPEHLWQMMYRQHFWHGHGIVRATAVAGIDIALWDILG